MIRVLFVCMGNICRSPAAQGVFEAVVAREGLSGEVFADSAGVSNYHAGDPPDSRMQAAARQRGIDLSHQRARQVVADDFHDFDLILAMDQDNEAALIARCPPQRLVHVRPFMSFAPQLGVTAVPDPYFGGDEGFEHVLDLLEAGVAGLIESLRARAV